MRAGAVRSRRSVSWWRWSHFGGAARRRLLVLALGPFGLAFVASVLGRYPYGGSARTMIFAAPDDLSAERPGARRHDRPGSAALGCADWRSSRSRAGLAISGIVLLGVKVAFPYKSIPDQNSRAFARSFWTEKARRLSAGLREIGHGARFQPSQLDVLPIGPLPVQSKDLLAPSSPGRRGRTGRPYRRSGRCAACCITNGPRTSAACSLWLRQMTEHFEIKRRETFIINESSHRDDGTDVEDRYTVFDFVPRQGRPTQQVAREASPRSTAGTY